MVLDIKEFKPCDREPVVSLWERCGLTRPWNNPHEDFDLATASASSTILVGRLDGRIIASVMVGFDGHRGWLYYLTVDPSYQGNGFGRELVAAAEEWLKAKGAPKADLMVRHDNADAVRFYKRMGHAPQDVTTLGEKLN